MKQITYLFALVLLSVVVVGCASSSRTRTAHTVDAAGSQPQDTNWALSQPGETK